MELINERKADKGLYSANASEFIPVVCYYDSNTLLTKNGNLVQTIEITGIDSEVISDKLGSLRKAIKNTLSAHINDSNIACWVHTVRHETDLDDHIPYSNKFAADLHDIWVTKNRLRSRFVNSLYISIVSRPKSFYSSDVGKVIDVSFLDAITKVHDDHLDRSVHNITSVVNNIMSDLVDYIPKRLSIRFDGDIGYADTLYIYNYVASLRGVDVEVPVQDFSKVLSQENYTVRGNKIEIDQKGIKKFASILSLKEYINEDNDGLLEHMLHLPVEFIATEILFSIDKKATQAPYIHQNYILSVSRDEEVIRAKNLDGIFSSEANIKYVMQQLSIMIIADEVTKLEEDTAKLSKSLSRIGFVNVREDINLENIFWSQMPANFKFMRRHVPNIINSSCAFVSIQNTPTGQRQSKWGRAVTVISTESGTPYFVNFHNAKQTGHTCIYGSAGMGKSILMNFFVSEAMKFNPTIVYLSVDDSSDLFIKAMGGQWYHDLKMPVLENKTHVIVGMMIDIMSGQYSRNCTDEEISIIKSLLSAINISGSFDAAVQVVRAYIFPDSCKKLQADMLSVVQYLESSNVQVKKGSIIVINLGALDNVESKDLRSAFVIAALRSLCFDTTSPKMLVIDEMTHMFDHPYYTNYISFVLNIAKAHNIAVIGTVDTDQYINNTSQKKLWEAFMENLDLQIVMHHKDIGYDLKTVFGLTEYEMQKLEGLNDKRRFIMKPSGQPSTIGELNISSISHAMRILSCDQAGRDIYENIIATLGDDPAIFLPELYKALQEQK